MIASLYQSGSLTRTAVSRFGDGSVFKAVVSSSPGIPSSPFANLIGCTNQPKFCMIRTAMDRNLTEHADSQLQSRLRVLWPSLDKGSRFPDDKITCFSRIGVIHA